MPGMTVNARSVVHCCLYHSTDFGKSRRGKLKATRKRQVKRAERQSWKRDVFLESA